MANPVQGRIYPLTTAQFAAALAIQPQSIRKRLAQTGSYFGVRPTKLPNGRLYWPHDALNSLLEGQSR